ncbi:uncharacterized protein LOC120930453 [Rana temporaria]|uniref:uncharacterized protein LOC120930453 n=1 Tax=Rana temporaria TaxID=8407 RepID=UPI001AADA6C8|nr:uncharacterized protein LOC120930453 [Rana temporaria]
MMRQSVRAVPELPPRKKSIYIEMLFFLRKVMDVRSTSSNVSECEENTDETEAVQGVEHATQEGEGQSQSVDADETDRPSARPSSSQRSVNVSHDRPTTSRSSRRGKKPKNTEMDKAMKSFMDEMTFFKRQESKNPFCDPNNSNVSFLRTIYHTLQKVPAERQMEIHMVNSVLSLLSTGLAYSAGPSKPVLEMAALVCMCRSDVITPPATNGGHKPRRKTVEDVGHLSIDIVVQEGFVLRFLFTISTLVMTSYRGEILLSLHS